MNQWLVTILDMIGVTVAFLAMAILFLMLKSMVRNKQKRRTKKMSSKSEAREGVTFNDIFMFMIRHKFYNCLRPNKVYDNVRAQ